MTDARTDTIAAIATPPGRGGVGIVRVSGPRVPSLATALLGDVPPPRRAVHRTFRDAGGAPIDDGLVPQRANWGPPRTSSVAEADCPAHGRFTRTPASVGLWWSALLALAGFTPRWCRSRTCNSQIQRLVLFPIELTTWLAQIRPSSESVRGTCGAYRVAKPRCIARHRPGRIDACL